MVFDGGHELPTHASDSCTQNPSRDVVWIWVIYVGELYVSRRNRTPQENHGKSLENQTL